METSHPMSHGTSKDMRLRLFRVCSPSGELLTTAGFGLDPSPASGADSNFHWTQLEGNRRLPCKKGSIISEQPLG